MSDEAVTNSTCLIALERVGQLGLLPRVFKSVFAPPAVQAELGSRIEWLIVKEVSDPGVAAALRTQLDEGEAHTIALAMELGDAAVILDDKKARRVGRQIGLKVIGTVGVLLLAKRKGVIPAIRPLLEGLQQAGFRMTEALYEEAHSAWPVKPLRTESGLCVRPVPCTGEEGRKPGSMLWRPSVQGRVCKWGVSRASEGPG